MAEQRDIKGNDSVEGLRLFVLTKAVEFTLPANDTGFQDAVRSSDVFPHGEPTDDEEGFPYYRIHTYREGTQDDGAIVQVSFEDYGIDEAHLTVNDEGLVYQESASDGSRIPEGEVGQVMARQLLERFRVALR